MFLSNLSNEPSRERGAKMKLLEEFMIVAVMAGLSAATYYAQVVIFNNPHDTFFYLLQDLAFVPVQVLLITMLLNRLLSMREKRAMLNKLNMLVGVFFSDLGNMLLRVCTDFDCDDERARRFLYVDDTWQKASYTNAAQRLRTYSFRIDAGQGDLAALKTLLLEKRSVMSGFLVNPNIFEHDTFSDMVWSVLHLTEELEQRSSLDGLPENDLQHLSVDIKRAYSLLLQEWLAYMSHLQTDYPYLFSLAVRNNPLKETNTIVIP